MEINKKKLEAYFERLNEKLEGITRKARLYCIGGTALTAKNKKYQSKDIDAIVSREDFRILSGITAEAEWKEKIRFDFFPDGEFADYALPYDFRESSKRVISLKNLEVYVIGDIDLVLTKALAGRIKDYDDIREIVKNISEKQLIKRFNQLKFEEGKKGQLQGKLEEFIGRFYL